MSPNGHSSSADAITKKLRTPLKSSVVLLTSVILASCGSDGSSTSYYSAPTPMATDTSESGSGSGEGASSGEGGSGGTTTPKETEDSNSEALKQAKADTESAKLSEQKAKVDAEESKKEAQQLKTELEAAKGQVEQAQAEAEQAQAELEEALDSGGGNSEELQAAAEAKAKQAEVALKTLLDAEAAAQVAIDAAEAKAQQAQDIIKAAADATAAAQIKNTPESAKNGAQTLNVDVGPLNKIFNTTTRDFTADDTSVVARADIASQNPDGSPGLLGALTITTSGDSDTDISNGFKAHNDSAIVAALGQELPLTYVSTYKDFGDDLRIGHIDGSAVFSAIELPVNGAAVIGKATQSENIPTAGTVGYTGDATHRTLGLGNSIEFGSSVFTADFVSKSVKGNLAFSKAGNIALSADIKGNQISGSAANNNGYATEGGFYGGDAQYLGGVYEGNGAQGTYGAKSDDQTAKDNAVMDVKVQADAAEQEIQALRAEADKAIAMAEQAKADADKAQAAADKAKARAENAGGSDALDDADAALQAKQVAETAQAVAEQAQVDAENALAAAQQAADKAVGDAKSEANNLVAQAKADTDTANQAATQAKADATAANTAADKAKTDADAVVAEANAKTDKAVQEALNAQSAADAANSLASDERAKAEQAQKEAQTAQASLITAQEDLSVAEKALADTLALGGGNTDALQAEVDRREEALQAANDKAAQAQSDSQAAIAATEAQMKIAQDALKVATDAAAAAQMRAFKTLCQPN